MDILTYNRRAWDAQVRRGNRWTLPVDAAAIGEARAGRPHIVLTPTNPVPVSWLMPLTHKDILCLASGGGQQGPILAAGGGRVTVFDNSPAQLARDAEVAARESLPIALEQGDMADLSRFADASFDLIVHPCSNTFVADIRPVWREAFRVLRPGGSLLSGFCQPVLYLFDDAAHKRGELVVRHPLPYSDLTHLTDVERQAFIDDEEPLIFGHTLDDQIGGQLDAGFVLAGFYEDRDPKEKLGEYIAAFAATRAVKKE